MSLGTGVKVMVFEEAWERWGEEGGSNGEEETH